MGRLGRRAKASSPNGRKRLLKKRGYGLDIQKWISKSGREWHWPGYQYMGPGIHLNKRLARGDPGINRYRSHCQTARYRVRASQDLEGQARGGSQDDSCHQPVAWPQDPDGQENHASQDPFQSIYILLLTVLLYNKKPFLLTMLVVSLYLSHRYMGKMSWSPIKSNSRAMEKHLTCT